MLRRWRFAKILGALCMVAGLGVAGLCILGFLTAMEELPTFEPGRSEASAEALAGLIFGGVVALVLTAFGAGIVVVGEVAERRSQPGPYYDPSLRR